MKLLFCGNTFILKYYAALASYKHDVSLFVTGKEVKELKKALLKLYGHPCSLKLVTHIHEEDYDYIFTNDIHASFLKETIYVGPFVKEKDFDMHGKCMMVSSLYGKIHKGNIEAKELFSLQAGEIGVPNQKIKVLDEIFENVKYVEDIYDASLTLTALICACYQNEAYGKIAKEMHFYFKKLMTYDHFIEPSILKVLYFLPEPFVGFLLKGYTLTSEGKKLKAYIDETKDFSTLKKDFLAYLDSRRLRIEDYLTKS